MICSVCGADVPYYEGERGVYRGQCQVCGKGYGGHRDDPVKYETYSKMIQEEERDARIESIMSKMDVRDKFFLLTDNDMVYGPFDTLSEAKQKSYKCDRHGDFYINMVKVAAVSLFGDIPHFYTYDSAIEAEGRLCQ